MDKSSLGDRMKLYEDAASRRLIKRMPVIIRLDGKAFHTALRPLNNRKKDDPWDIDYHSTMVATVEYLFNNIQNVVFAYSQSDEITLLLKDWTELTTEQWFNGKQSKIESISASMVTGAFNYYAHQTGLAQDLTQPFVMFDSRAFNIPKEDVINNFIWRQQDATRNSIQMLGRFYFSHKELFQKNQSNIQDMLMLKHNINWNDFKVWKKRGFCYFKDQDGNVILDEQPPIFTQDRNYIEKHLL